MKDNFNNTTNDDLARMIAKGFEGVDQQFSRVDRYFDKVESRLDKIEALLVGNYKKRIEKLELEMKELREALALK